MGCPASLAALQGVEANTRAMMEYLSQPKPTTPQVGYSCRLYDTLCSTIGTVRKLLVADDTTLPPDTLFTRLTVKVRSLGTNTYIAFGAAATPAFRFTGVGQSHTFIAPIMNGNTIPFKVNDIIVLGDGATGVLEISGVRLSTDVMI
ncbi:MAG: hypothetical protein PHW28_11515, partial [Mesotoga sp.]|nr:hypothetical protein [Mesotoga sp.]